MDIIGFDHLVLCVADVDRTIAFYRDVLGMTPREERPGKWSLHFGAGKISLQDAVAEPTIAADTVPGSGNFCVLAAQPVDWLVENAERLGISITAGPGLRDGAAGKIRSVYFRDPDGNLVEVSNSAG